MSDQEAPLHVVHILGSLKYGGVEKWLYEMQGQADPRQLRYSYIVSEMTGSDLEARFLASGACVHVCDVRRGALPYGAHLYRSLKRLGPVQVVHSHVHAFSAFNLMIAAACGIPVRIAHSHTDRSVGNSKATIYRRAYHLLAKRLLRSCMTGGVAVSRAAGRDLFGDDGAWGNSVSVVPCGIDLARFARRVDRGGMRDVLGILPTEKVLMHVGNFVEPKNHEFIVEVGCALLGRRRDVKIVLVGSGPLESRIRDLIARSGFTSRFLLLGSRPDVPELLLGLADAFVLPSRWEGLPVALIEAQAAGLPCVVSTNVTTEVVAPGASVRYMSLDDEVSEWASSISAALDAGRQLGDLSRFSVSRSHDLITAVYRRGRIDAMAGPRCAQ